MTKLLEQAIARKPQIDATEPRANKVVYDDGRFALYFDNGASFSFLVKSVEAIARRAVAEPIATLSSEILATVELTPSGKELRWNEPEVVNIG